MLNTIERDFTMIPNALINKSEISRDARFLFVYLLSKPADWKFYTKTVEKDLNCSKDSRIKYMKELAEAGWISTEQIKKPSGEWGAVNIILHSVPIIPTPKKTAAEIIGSGENTLHSNTDLKSNTNEIKNKDSLLFADGEIKSIPEEVLQYLNDKRKEALPNTQGFGIIKSNLSHIKVRLKEGYKLDQFKKVIDSRLLVWAQSKKMKEYIRPETLFGDKFDQYLVEADEILNNSSSGVAGSGNFEYNPATTAKLK